MDNIRIMLWFGFLAMLWLSFSQWMTDYSERPAAPVAGAEQAPTPLPQVTNTLPQAEPLPAATPTPGVAVPEAAPAEVALENPIYVRTDVLDVTIDRTGGDIVRVDLPTYPVEKHEPDRVVRLLDYVPPERWIYQTGVRNAETPTGPTHLVEYTSRSNDYALADGSDELVVTLDWKGTDGVSGRKTYTFKRGQFAIGLDVELRNESAEAWSAVPYAQMLRHYVPNQRKYMAVDTYSFRGPVVYNGESYEKLDFDDLKTEPLSGQYTNGWFASIQHHFLAAAAPPIDTPYTFQATVRGDDAYLLTAIGPSAAVAPRSTQSFRFDLFVGPKLHDQLSALREGLVLTVDYGKILTPLAQPLFWLLDKVHGFVGNWGWAIIFVTFLIKLAFYKLTATSGRSLAKMRKVGPRLKALQERFKDDRQALSQAMMELYKKEKINPAAGCLPILIQMPFFFAFYWVLIESVEMRQAPFMLWIDDLSRRDPYFVLPVLMGAAMLFQTRLSPAPPDPIQARVMQFMPLVFCAMFAFFPAGLVLYWLTNTALSILQQWRINKLVAAES
jgi:YidC/Oxa1 family membrane protein insertase